MIPIYDPIEQKNILLKSFTDSGKSNLNPYIIKYIETSNYLQIILDRTDRADTRPLLYIRTHSAKGGRPADLIARENEAHYLLHDGRSRKRGYDDFIWENGVNLKDNGIYYNTIGELNNNISERILEYHLSRKYNGENLTSDRAAFDPGPSDVQNAPPHVRNQLARHNAVSEQLKATAEKFGWVVRKRVIYLPDLAIEKNGSTLIFEVKPDAALGSMCKAIGQIIVYDSEYCSNERHIIAPEYPALRRRLCNLLETQEIIWTTYDMEAGPNGKVRFSDNLIKRLKD
ncbi:MAG TPA: hypothetical protein VIN77_14035 [Aurantimonas sp.]